MIRVIKQFLSQKEVKILNEWTLKHYEEPFFEDPRMDLYCEKTRLTTRIVTDNPPSFHHNITYPKEAFNIQKRIQTKFKITNPVYPPPFRYGIVNGIGFENGTICLHRDPQYFSNTVTVHCNFITQKPISGGITVIEEKEYNIDERDMLMYAVSEVTHRVTQTIGTKERILWCYGFCLEKNKIQEIFAQ